MRRRPTPSAYTGRPFPLTPSDLENHPLADEYIAYAGSASFPIDFKEYVRRKTGGLDSGDARSRARLHALAADPYCRSPVKRRRT